MKLRIMKPLLLAALCVLLCFATQAQTAAVQQAAKGASLEGTLTKAGTGEPIRGAEVTVVRQSDVAPRIVNESDESSQITTVTDAAGRFRFPNLRPGSYSLLIRKNGFHGFRGPNSRTWQETLNISVQPGQAIEMALAMQPGGAVAGRVVDDQGEPLAYVQVSALKWVYANHRRQLRAVGMGTTDDQGNYRIFALEPGRYLVRANAVEGAGKLRYAPSYFPDSGSPDAASILSVRGGDTVEADFHLTRVRAARVSGRLSGNGAPVQVYLHSLEDDSLRAAGSATGKDGSFTIDGVLPGDYILSAVELNEEAAEGPQHAEMPLKVDGHDIANLSLTLEEGGKASVQGTLRLDTANVAHPPLGSLRIGLLPVDAGSASGEYVGSPGYTAVGRDGQIRMEHVPPGKYVVSITAQGGGWEDFYTKSVQVGGRDVTEGEVVLSANRGVVPITVTVGIDGAFLEGTVVDEDGKPVADATVIGVPDTALRNQYDLYQRGESDANGHFRLRGVRPGRYSLYAWNAMDDESYMDPGFLRNYEAARVDVTLAPNDHQKVDLRVQSADE